MNSSIRPTIAIGVDQQVSARQKNGLQADAVKHEPTLTTRSGLRLALIGVADGEGQQAPEQAARMAVQAAFQSVEGSVEKNIPMMLQRAMQAANAAVRRDLPGGLAGMTLAAIAGNQLFCVHAGEQTRTYVVRGGGVKTLGRSLAAMIGQGGEISTDRLTVTGEILKPGDQVVVCSDGLFRLVPEKEVAVIGRYPAPLEAARHLSSLSMGRNVDDNVSVTVVQYGKKPGRQRALLIAAAVAVLTFLIILSAAGLIRRQTQRPPDTGLAYVIDGQVNMIDPTTDTPSSAAPLASFIPAGWGVQAISDAHLRFAQEGGNDLPGNDIYLSSGTIVNLVTIDYSATFENGRAVDSDAVYLNLTEIGLDSDGRILIKNGGNRQYSILLGEGRATIPANSPGSILGVERKGEQATIDCLKGTCLWDYKDNAQPITANTMIKINITTGQPIPGSGGLADLEAWQALCQDCMNR